MVKPPSILIATSNAGKVREVEAALAGFSIELVTLTQLDAIAPPVESETTFEGNARLKATYYAGHANRWALADDSGLEVDALGGAPGVYSSRFAGKEGDDAANNTKLLMELESIPQSARSARFHCVMALSGPDDFMLVARGSVEGTILDKPRGEDGFGYDPLFFIPELGYTAAELPLEQKNAISHRGQALRSLREQIEKLFVE